ncbi:unnamed protein product [Porites evermanni]|uniref:Neurotransmitter-gated ion-channel transmembrane domain-containing protein n=1 Tax=Porites evermanni TaxID=104178 RepID=A0ABN8SVF9_9CNID|nr:unnamed protein product [Porites evermanni]
MFFLDAYPTQHLVFKWLVLDKEMAQFYMNEMSTAVGRTQYVAGEYSLLQATFSFKRRMGFYLIQIYIPCIAVVLVAWMSLFIDSRATPARVSLCITTLLTISTIWGAVNSSMPRVSYVKAIDVYLMASFFFILCTMLEYIGLIHQERAKKGLLRIKAPFFRKVDLHRESCDLTSESSLHQGELCSVEEGKRSQVELNDVKKNEGSSVQENDKIDSTGVDFAARIAFMAVFALFNFFYWFVLIYFNICSVFRHRDRQAPSVNSANTNKVDSIVRSDLLHMASSVEESYQHQHEVVSFQRLCHLEAKGGLYGVNLALGKSPISYFILAAICFLQWTQDLRTLLIAPRAFPTQNCSLNNETTCSTPQCPFTSCRFRIKIVAAWWSLGKIMGLLASADIGAIDTLPPTRMTPSSARS